jgi:peptide/nickel transport system substrate-binding protein
MSLKRTTFFALSLVAVLSVLLAACAPPPTPTEPALPPTEAVEEATEAPAPTEAAEEATEAPAPTEAPAATEPPAAEGPQGTLTIGLTTNVTALEQPYAPERQSDNASWTLFDALAFPEADGTYSPALAESWEVSEDGTTYTFHLRQDVTFHNGEPFNADAVVFSWETYRQPEVTYANEWTIAESVEKVDDYTITVSTSEPNALLLPIIASSWAIIPVDWGGVTKEEFAENPVGTGPFMLEEWVKSDHVTVVANPNYWNEGYPKLERVVFKFLPESATRVAAVQTGEIDIAPRLTSEDIAGLEGVEGVEVVRYPVNRSYYVAFNNITTGVGTPLEDPMVRQALTHAVDVDAIIEALFEGFATRSVGFVGPTDLGFDGAEPVAYDPELALQLLSDAGYPDGFEMDMACPDGAYSHINEVCEAIRGYFDEVGVTGELSIMESNAYWELEANKELPPIFVDAWSVTLSEAYPRLEGALAEGQTYANWFNPELDALIKQVATTVDVDERAALYGEIQQMMRDDPPFIYLYYPEAFEGVTARVENYQPRSAEQYYLWDVSVTDAQ